VKLVVTFWLETIVTGILCAAIHALVSKRDNCLNIDGVYMEVWFVPSATHTHTCVMYTWKSECGPRYQNLSTLVIDNYFFYISFTICRVYCFLHTVWINNSLERTRCSLCFHIKILREHIKGRINWTDWGDPYKISVRKPECNRQVLGIVLIIKNNIKNVLKKKFWFHSVEQISLQWRGYVAIVRRWLKG